MPSAAPRALLVEGVAHQVADPVGEALPEAPCLLGGFALEPVRNPHLQGAKGFRRRAGFGFELRDVEQAGHGVLTLSIHAPWRVSAGPAPWKARARLYTNIIPMLTKRLTKIGDSTGLVIDKPILDLLGFSRGDEVQLKIEDNRLVILPLEGAARRRAKFTKAKARVHANVGTVLEKLAK